MSMDDVCDETDTCSLIAIGAAVAILIAVVISGYLLVFTGEQHLSLYIVPDSYQYHTGNDTISFRYGIFGSEDGTSDYDIQIFVQNELMSRDRIRLDSNEQYEQNEYLNVTEDLPSPVKVEVLLTNMNTMESEDVHFWIETNT